MQLGAEPTRTINIGLNQQCPAGYTASDYPTYRSCRYSGFPPVAPAPAPAPAVITVSPSIQTQVSPQVSPVFQQAFQPQQSPMTAGTTQTTPTSQQAGSPTVVPTSRALPAPAQAPTVAPASPALPAPAQAPTVAPASPALPAPAQGPSGAEMARMYELQLQAQRDEAAAQRKLIQDVLSSMGTRQVASTSAPVAASEPVFAPIPLPREISAPAPAATSGGVVIPELPKIEKAVTNGKNTQAAIIAGAVLVGLLLFMKGPKNAPSRR